MRLTQTHPWARFLPLLFLAALTLLQTWPLARYLGSAVADWHDPLLNAWIIAWEGRQLLLDPLHLFDANIFYPYENTLAFSEILLSVSLPVLPLLWAGLPPLAAHNSAFLLSFFLAALGSYLLAFHLTRHRVGSVIAAVIFAFGPYRFGQLSQVQLLATGWLPLALLYLDRLLARSQASERIKRDSFLFGFFFLLQTLSSFYTALFTAGACLLYSVGWWLLVARGRVPQRALRYLAVTALVVLLLLLPVLVPYFYINRTFQAAWTVADNVTFSAPLQAFLYAPPPLHLWGSVTERFYYLHGSCCAGSSLFPTLTALLLALLGVGLGRDRRRWLALALVLVGFVLALGPTLQWRPNDPSGIALPYRWLLEHLPLFSALRAPVRWGLLLMLGLALLAAWGARRLGRGAWIPLALLLVEVAVFPLVLVRVPAPPPAIDWLAAQPPTRLLELPLSVELTPAEAVTTQPPGTRQVSRLPVRQYHSTWHWHSTPDGYSGYIPPYIHALNSEMQAFPSERSLALLQSLGIQYVLLYEQDFSPERLAYVAARLPNFSALRTVACFVGKQAHPPDRCPAPADRMLHLLPPSAQATDAPNWSLLVAGSVAPEQPAPLWLAMDTPDYLATPADHRFPMTIQWEGPTSRKDQTSLALPIIAEQAALIQLESVAPELPGDYTITVTAPSLPNGPVRLQAQLRVEAAAGEPGRWPLGVALDEAQISGGASGAPLRATLQWRFLQYHPSYHTLTVQALDEAGTLLAETSGPPGGEHPTIEWQVGRPYGSEWLLHLPQEAPPARYLRLRWADAFSGRQDLIWHEGQWREELLLEVVQ